MVQPIKLLELNKYAVWFGIFQIFGQSGAYLKLNFGFQCIWLKTKPQILHASVSHCLEFLLFYKLVCFLFIVWFRTTDFYVLLNKKRLNIVMEFVKRRLHKVKRIEILFHVIRLTRYFMSFVTMLMIFTVQVLKNFKNSERLQIKFI